MLNVFNVKTKFEINYCHNEELYNFTILNSSNNEILFNSQYENIIEVNKIIQQYKQKYCVTTTKQKLVLNKTTLFTNKIRYQLDNNINTK